MTSNKELYEIRSDEAYRHFYEGYATMYASGRCDDRADYLKMMDHAFAELERAHAIEPDNPHIVYWMGWCKDFLRVPPDEIIPILELALELCKNPAYHHTDHIVDIVTYALDDYKNRLK